MNEQLGCGTDRDPAGLTTAALFAAAVGLRVLVYLVLGPIGHDDHYAVIQRLLEDHRIPPSGATAQSFHPPAYYLLGVPWALVGGPRGVEALSLLLSIVNLWLLFGLLGELPARPRIHAMLLVALLPQFVIYGILVSNDTLAMLMGTVLLLAALRFRADPSLRNASLAGLAAGAALLSKGTLLGHVAVLGVVVVFCSRRLAFRQAVRRVSAFAVLALAIGAYKFVDNQIHFGRPLVHTMDFSPGWMTAQQPTVTSPWSLVNVDVGRLLREPHGERPHWRVSEPGGTNPESIPLLLYATFWHPYAPVSNFRGTFDHQPWLARATYVAAVPITLLLLVGLAIAVRRRPLAVALLAANAAVVVAAGLRYDAWSCFNARLILPAMATIAFGLGYGIEWAGRGRPLLRRVVDLACGGVYALFVLYFALEIAHVTRTVLG